MSVIDLTDKMRKQFNIKQFGVLVKQIVKGAGENAGIRGGDLIMQFNGVNVKNVKHLNKLVVKAENSKYVPVLINRQGNPIFLALKK
jgi:serine protease Do